MGLLAWILAGIVIVVAERFVPPRRGQRGCLVALVTVGAAVTGGVVATLLGFGGALDLDPLGVVVATLAAGVAAVGIRLVERG